MAKSQAMSEQAKDNPANPDTASADAASVPETSGSGEMVTEAETAAPTLPKEIGGREGPEPVRYGDWEKNGRCIDF